jgi:uncharacterized membrane-anchored protein
MKKYLPLGIVAVVLLLVNAMIVQKEHVLSRGQTMLLELGSRDPRSLIQGDYMVLRYRIAQGIPADRLESRGCLVVRLDEHNVAGFVRVHHGEELREGEHLLSYHKRGEVRLGAESFFFQEGHAAHYAGARYGEIKVAENGGSVLVGLRGADFVRLAPK